MLYKVLHGRNEHNFPVNTCWWLFNTMLLHEMELMMNLDAVADWVELGFQMWICP